MAHPNVTNTVEAGLQFYNNCARMRYGIIEKGALTANMWFGKELLKVLLRTSSEKERTCQCVVTWFATSSASYMW